jgi:hypothetical protein
LEEAVFVVTLAAQRDVGGILHALAAPDQPHQGREGAATGHRRGQRGAEGGVGATGPTLPDQLGVPALHLPAVGDSRQAVAASTSRRTSCGWSMANCWAIEPPVEIPWTNAGPGNWRAMASA